MECHYHWNLSKYSCFVRGTRIWNDGETKDELRKWVADMRKSHSSCLVVVRLSYSSLFQRYRHPWIPSKASRPPGRTLWTWFSHVSDPFSTLIICFAIVSNQNSLGQDMNICINSRRSWHSINYFNNDRQKSEVNSF